MQKRVNMSVPGIKAKSIETRPGAFEDQARLTVSLHVAGFRAWQCANRTMPKSASPLRFYRNRRKRIERRLPVAWYDTRLGVGRRSASGAQI